MGKKSKSRENREKFQELERLAQNSIKFGKAGIIVGLVFGTGALAAGIFLPKEINDLTNKILEFTTTGLSYALAGIGYVTTRIFQYQLTQLHMRPEYIDALHKSLGNY